MSAWTIGFLACFLAEIGHMFWWRAEAERLNEENLALTMQLDEIAAEDRPRIQFGPHLGANRHADFGSDFPDLLFTERQWNEVNPPLPRGVRHVILFQRSES